MTTQELFDEALSLPVDERAQLAELLWRSLSATDPERDRQWGEVAQRRLQEMRDGRVKGAPDEEVFADRATSR